MDKVKATLEGLQPVNEVGFLPEQGLFIVAYNSPEPLAEEFKEVVEGGVVAPRLRKKLSDLGAFFNS